MQMGWAKTALQSPMDSNKWAYLALRGGPQVCMCSDCHQPMPQAWLNAAQGLLGIARNHHHPIYASLMPQKVRGGPTTVHQPRLLHAVCSASLAVQCFR